MQETIFCFSSLFKKFILEPWEKACYYPTMQIGDKWLSEAKSN